MAKDNFKKREGKNIDEIAESQVANYICKYGLEDARQLAELVLEKIKAKQNLKPIPPKGGSGQSNL